MPATENLVNKTEWSSLTGLILDGGYEMKEPLELEVDSALFKIRILGGWGQEATVRLYHADLAQAEEQLSFWQTLREWPHPNVGIPLAAGYRWLGDVGVVYVILPIPDEKLSGVLSERALSVEEATEVVRNIASALGHLHACGLAHGSIAPENVWAVGNAIQVSVESVRRQGADLLISPPDSRYLAPESEGFNNTPAADIWSLGATLFEVLSQRRYDPFSKDRVRSLPFFWLMQRCLEESPETRCTLSEALSIFARGPKAAPPPPKPVIPEPAAAPQRVAEIPVAAAEQAGPEAPGVETPVRANVLTNVVEMPLAGAAAAAKEAKAAEPVIPAEPIRVEPNSEKPSPELLNPERPVLEPETPPATNGATGPGARVAASEEARKTAATGDAFRKASTASAGTSSIFNAPLPSESRHKPAEMKRKPVAAKIRQVGSSGLGLSETAFEGVAAGDTAVTRLSGAKPWATTKPRTRHLAIAGIAIAIMFLAVIFLVVVPRLQSPMDPAGPPTAGSKGNAWQTKTLAPAAEANAARNRLPAAAVPVPAKPAPAEAAGPNNNWRLVLYSYKYKQDAERRIVLLKRAHPDMDARLFVPVKKWPFMVVMGGPMSKDSAEDLKKQAIAEGMPRAIYAQRF